MTYDLLNKDGLLDYSSTSLQPVAFDAGKDAKQSPGLDKHAVFLPVEATCKRHDDEHDSLTFSKLRHSCVQKSHPRSLPLASKQRISWCRGTFSHFHILDFR